MDDPPRVLARPPAEPPRRGGMRPVACALFLVGLSAACVAVLRSGVDAARPTTVDAPVGPRSSTVPVAPRDGCAPLPGPEQRRRCPITGGVLDTRVPEDLARAYRDVAGADDGVAATGPASCAGGLPEERAWSRVAAPIRAAGRYLCRAEDGRAALWWTDERSGVLAHATRDDGDLAALFAWWLASGQDGGP
ncbi:MAG: hypothetical protein ACT4OX_13375 [Actinomycetota bacterium]